MNIDVVDIHTPNETLRDLYGPMYRYYPRQWVNLIGPGSKVTKNGVEIDFDLLKTEWQACVDQQTVTRKMSYILMYVYSMWIKQNTRYISGLCAEMIHAEIITTISKFYTVKLSPKTRNPVYSILALFTRIQSHTSYKLFAPMENNKRHKYFQLRTNLEMSTTSLRHDLLTDDDGAETYTISKWDFDWDFGDRLDDEN